MTEQQDINSEDEVIDRQTIKAEQERKSAELKGIGGWLIIVAIGVTLTPFILAADLLGYYNEFQTEDYLQSLINPSSPDYNQSFVNVLYVESALNLILLTASIFLLYAFYAKKKYVPKLYVGFHVYNVLVLVSNLFVTAAIFDNISASDVADAETTRAIIRGVLTILIWGSYMRLSVRVKNTFVN